MTLTIREIKNEIEDMELGEELFINALYLNSKGVDFLKSLIANGVLTLNDRSLNNIVKDAQYEYLVGEKILPQADYIKIGEI